MSVAGLPDVRASRTCRSLGLSEPEKVAEVADVDVCRGSAVELSEVVSVAEVPAVGMSLKCRPSS